MANVKITELTAATALAGTDVLPIVDVGADATKKVSVSDLMRNLPDGTASAPALAFADDQNTGVLSPGNNSLAFATSGTQRLLIDSAGKFGFGTSTVSTAKFTFNSAGTNEVARFESTDAGAYLSLKDSTSSSSNFIEGGADQLSFGTNSNERLRIDSNGRVGIGTTSPENNLHIANTSGPVIRLTNSTGTDGTYTGRISTGDAAGTFFAGINFFKHDTNDGEIRFRTKVAGSNQDTVTIVDGRVGIGTTSPTAELHVVKSSGESSLFLDRTSGALLYAQATASAGVIGTGTNHPVFIRQNGGDAITIDTSKRVGIGTTSPSAQIHLNQSGTGSYSTLKLSNSGASGRTYEIGVGGSTSGSGYAGNLYFYDSTASARRAVIDSSGRLGLGTASPGSFEDSADNFVISGTGNTGLTIDATSSTSSSIHFADGPTGSESYRGFISYAHFDDSMRFGAAGSERMRVDSSGAVLINRTSKSDDEKLSVEYPPANTGIIIDTDASFSGNSVLIEFKANGTTGGSIVFTNNGTTTAYVTSSDYRLKENVVDLGGAITRVKQLSPKRFNFIVDADTTVDGFLAHEAQTVVPEAVTGTHNEVDGDGNAVMQGIDQSKLVPLLTAALQEAIAKIETLETKVAALEAQ